jgi:phage terminase small subunit
MAELSPRQQQFVVEYCVDRNATQAAIRAGYKSTTAAEQASRLLTNVKIKEAVEAKLKRLEAKTELSAEWVLTSFKNIAERCMQATPVVDKDGNETGEYKFDANGANKALEMIGKHLKLFTDKQEITGSMNNTTTDLTGMTPEERRARIDELNRRRGNGASTPT